MDLEQGLNPAWAVFDRAWYREQYRQAILDIAGDISDDDLEGFWRNQGAAYGHRPNCYFDEIFYRRNNPSVGEGIHRGIFVSGFQHYEEIGYQGCAPHWLFDENAYFLKNPDLNMQVLRQSGLLNGYDHYIRHGQIEQRLSNPFFDPDVLRVSLFLARLDYFSPQGEFTRALTDPEVGALRCTWYFDQPWYLEQYPEVRDSIGPGAYHSALHHYLSNDTPGAFNPTPFFDEEWYLAAYPDVAIEVKRGAFRNGYAHFMRFGIIEGRKPLETIDLPSQDICSERDNAYITFVKANGVPAGSPDRELTRDNLEVLQARRTSVMFAQLIRAPLDFTTLEEPSLAAVIPVENDFPSLMETLVSLNGARRVGLQVVIVDLTGHRFMTRIESWAKGVTVIRADGAMPLNTRKAVAEAIKAPVTLSLDPGLVLIDPDITRLITALTENTDIAAFVPQTRNVQGRVVDAGINLWKNGDIDLVGAGACPTDDGLQHRRVCDSFARNAFLCRTADLTSISLQNVFESSYGYFTAMGLTLRQNQPGTEIVCDPRFVVQDRRLAVHEPLLASTDRASILRQFGDRCQARPFKSDGLRKLNLSADSAGRRVFVLTRNLPHEKILGDQMRFAASVNEMVALKMSVTIFVTEAQHSQDVRSYHHFDDAVAIYHASADRTLAAFLQAAGGFFDYIWLNGLQMLDPLESALASAGQSLPITGYILDARDHGLLDASRRIPTNLTPDGWVRHTARQETLAESFSRSWMAQRIVLSSAQDARDLRNIGVDHTFVLRKPRVDHAHNGFARRAGLLFAVPVLQANDVGYRALLWTLREVMPRVAERLGDDIRLVVSATRDTAGLLSELRHYNFLSAPITGFCAFPELCDKTKLLIDPTDSTLSLSAEAEEGLSRGVPLVTVGEGTESGVVYASNAPELFAEAIATLYENADAWEVYAEFARDGRPEQSETLAQMRDLFASSKMPGALT